MSSLSTDVSDPQSELERKRAEKRAEIAAKVEASRQKASDAKQVTKFFSEVLDNFSKCMLEGMAPPPRNLQQHMPDRVAKTIFRDFSKLLQKGLPPATFRAQMSSLYQDYQQEYSFSSGPWQNISHWDFSGSHLEAIEEWARSSLPEGTIFASPCSGKGFFEACINAYSGIGIQCNDIEEPDFFFGAQKPSQMDGIEFLESLGREKPKVIVISWLPQRGHKGSYLSEAILRFAFDPSNNVAGVIHISESFVVPEKGRMVGCTDTASALNFKESHFTTVVERSRDYPAPWEHDFGMPFNDSLSIVVPKH